MVIDFIIGVILIVSLAPFIMIAIVGSLRLYFRYMNFIMVGLGIWDEPGERTQADYY